MSFISKVELKYQLQQMGVKVEGNYVRKSDVENALGQITSSDTETQDEWGFSGASVRSAGRWEKVLNCVGIRDGALEDNGHGTRRWVWKADGIVIVTGRNPITGKRLDVSEKIRVGYVGYMGIRGNANLVKKAVEMIKKQGDYKEETPHKSGFLN